MLRGGLGDIFLSHFFCIPFWNWTMLFLEPDCAFLNPDHAFLDHAFLKKEETVLTVVWSVLGRLASSVDFTSPITRILEKQKLTLLQSKGFHVYCVLRGAIHQNSSILSSRCSFSMMVK